MRTHDYPYFGKLPTTSTLAGGCLSLAVAMFLCRLAIIRPEIDGADWLRTSYLIAFAVHQDAAIAFILTSALLIVDWFAKSKRIVPIAFFVVASVLLMAGLANVEIVRLLGEPFTLNWLRYSDFLRGVDAQNAIKYSLTASKLITCLLASLAFVAISVVLGFILRAFMQRFIRPIFAGLGVVSLAFLVLLPREHALPTAKYLNPVVAFVQSLVTPAKLSLAPSGTVGDVYGGMGDHNMHFLPRLQNPHGVRNVVFFVLESTPAEYLQNYGGKYNVTPNLLHYSGKSAKFGNIYAHAPATNYSLVSLINSIYPEVSSRSMTEQYPNFPISSIADVLGALNYRTGFFNSSDNRFQSAGTFLSNKGFDIVEDYRTRNCDTEVFRNSSSDWRFMDFSSDNCTVESLMRWIEIDTQRPFFAIMWTGMTHYPYFTSGSEKPYVDNPSLNRYLNALHESDKAFGALMEFLKSSGLEESTLVVVLGDHGEAFGRHGTFVHASGLFQENVHIPLLLVNSSLFAGGSADVLGGISDVSPTVLDILGFDPPSQWQGRSLFAANRPKRVFFFAPWKGFQVGYREGTYKFIYETDTDDLQIFDLGIDPDERINLALQKATTATNGKKMIASWVQAQNAYIDEVLNGPSKVATRSDKEKRHVKLTVYASGTSYLTSPKAQILVDGVYMGGFAVERSPNNSQRIVTEAEIQDAFEPYVITLPPNTCPAQISIQFINDEWAGEGKTGDTNLFIKGVQLNNTMIPMKDITTDDPNAVTYHAGYTGLARNGALLLRLSEAVCEQLQLTQLH